MEKKATALGRPQEKSVQLIERNPIAGNQETICQLVKNPHFTHLSLSGMGVAGVSCRCKVGGGMSRRGVLLAILGFVALAIAPALAQKTLTATEAKDHIGEQATVCGKVVSTRYSEDSRGKPTFLNFDQPYPNHIFTVLIWGNDRSKFGDPEAAYRGKHLCVTGTISAYKNVPEIVASQPSQVKLQKE